jgi:hypothetical protein
MNDMTLERRLDTVDNAKRSDPPRAELVPALEVAPLRALATRPTTRAAEAPRPRWRLSLLLPGLRAEGATPEGVDGAGVKWTPLVALPDFPIPILLTSATERDRALFARRLHNLGPRRHGPFVTVGCLGRHPDEIDMALFGDALWSATAAGDPDGGAVVAAMGGTLYIDEVSVLSLFTQAKLLHAVERRRHPSAATGVERHLDFRLIVATTVDLWEEVRRGRFRASLLFAISGLVLLVPPLAPRTERSENGRPGSAVPVVHPRRWDGPRAA